jgi:hypothetical protein
MTTKYTRITGPDLIKTGQGSLTGIVVNSHSSGTLVFYDAIEITEANIINNTITLASGERNIAFYDMAFTSGLYIATGGTVDITVYYS